MKPIVTVIIRLLVLASPLLLNDFYLSLIPEDATKLNLILDVIVYIGWQTSLLYVAYHAGWFSWNSLGIKIQELGQWVKGVGIFLLVFTLYTILTFFLIYIQKKWNIKIESFWYFPLPHWESHWVLLYVLYLSITAGVYEEIIYRGITIHQLKSLTSKPWILICSSTVLFVAIHWSMGLGTWIEAALWGSLWAYLYIKNNALLPVIVAHFLYDFVTIYGLHTIIINTILL